MEGVAIGRPHLTAAAYNGVAFCWTDTQLFSSGKSLNTEDANPERNGGVGGGAWQRRGKRIGWGKARGKDGSGECLRLRAARATGEACALTLKSADKKGLYTYSPNCCKLVLMLSSVLVFLVGGHWDVSVRKSIMAGNEAGGIAAARERQTDMDAEGHIWQHMSTTGSYFAEQTRHCSLRANLWIPLVRSRAERWCRKNGQRWRWRTDGGGERLRLRAARATGEACALTLKSCCCKLRCWANWPGSNKNGEQSRFLGEQSKIIFWIHKPHQKIDRFFFPEK